MLSRSCAPAQAQEVEVSCVAEKFPQLHEHTIGGVSEPEDSDVLTPALWAVGTHSVFGPTRKSCHHHRKQPKRERKHRVP
jgi:hypothetical protein